MYLRVNQSALLKRYKNRTTGVGIYPLQTLLGLSFIQLQSTRLCLLRKYVSEDGVFASGA